VRIGERLADLLEDEKKPVQILRERLSLRQQRRQCLSLHELHREERTVIAKSAHLVNGNDAGMLQLPGDARLFKEPAEHFGIVLVVFQQDFESQLSIELWVKHAKDRAHAASGDFLNHLVANPAAAGRDTRSSPYVWRARQGVVVARRMGHYR
jgi:hypothetical protein